MITGFFDTDGLEVTDEFVYGSLDFEFFEYVVVKDQEIYSLCHLDMNFCKALDIYSASRIYRKRGKHEPR